MADSIPTGPELVQVLRERPARGLTWTLSYLKSSDLRSNM